jgi:hypothetical protein
MSAKQWNQIERTGHSVDYRRWGQGQLELPLVGKGTCCHIPLGQRRLEFRTIQTLAVQGVLHFAQRRRALVGGVDDEFIQ